MTCIVGLEHDGVVTIAGDTAGTDSWLRQAPRSDDKVFRVGPYVLGFTTSYRMGQLLRYRLNVNGPDSWDVDRFMATTFVDAVRDCLKTGGWSELEKNREKGGTFLIGVAGRLYRVESDFQVGRNLDGYDAVGCGDTLAMGSLHTTGDLALPPETRLERALLAAAHFSAGVAGPFTSLTTTAPVSEEVA